ncbi:MAG TPA: proline racemase family protein [Pyrinomonadaceae bacterium]|nr:proline racemase family protein [Pyrinomonadaceae bacterium]
MQRIRVIDSHTAGEPTRVVLHGFPDLGKGSMAEQLNIFRQKFDHLRNAIVNEPRGHSAIVGALFCESSDKSCDAGVIFFNNVGFLKMCGHGTIGLVKTLEFLGKISVGKTRIETPVGIIEADLDADGFVTITNVPSYRYAKNVEIEVANYGKIRGDIAWGGNWFFLIEEHSLKLELTNLQQLTEFTTKVRVALSNNGFTGENGQEIDHIEIFSKTENADSRNFVLCPGIEYDRSPCGTGTSAKLACLYEDGKLGEGEIWRQESIIGSIFEGKVKIIDGKIIPQIRGNAFITADNELILDENDPFRFGIS